MTKRYAVSAALVAIAALVVLSGTATGAGSKVIHPRKATSGPEMSGTAEFRDMDLGTTITECPQAGLAGKDKENPLDRRKKDKAEQLSEGGDDVRANTDYSCFPQNETSIAIHPFIRNRLTSGQNDYRTLSRQGFNSSADKGSSWYSAELPPPSVPDGDVLDASGDPVYIFDRAGIAYSSAINFNRTDEENGITVQRSTNGGYTWTRPCVPIPTTDPFTPETDPGRCGSIGDPRQPGDGVVTYFDDPDRRFGGVVPPFDDKEWMASGPRPAGVQPVCFSPFTRTPGACDPDVVGVDRLYVTWTRFEDDPAALFAFTAQIMLSYSDDQGRSWSPARVISANAPFCGSFTSGAQACDLNQFSVPTVHQRTGLLGIAFENFNTPDENQYLFVRSRDGGQTFEGPFFITPVFDVNYPTSGGPEEGGNRLDCQMRGQQNGRAVLTNSCFRVNSGGNVVVDKRSGAFGDDFYLVMSDNRNGTRVSSNTDTFFFKSTDGGTTWVGPTRVNNDRSVHPTNASGQSIRDCDRIGSAGECPTNADYGNDQWFPWLDVNTKGVLAVGFHDRRLDTNSTRGEWPMSRQPPNGRPGNYLAWFWGAGCQVSSSSATPGRECLSAQAAVVPQPAAQCITIDPGPPPTIVPAPGACSNPATLVAPPGANQTSLPFRNGVISDVPHNLDYSFRAGIFMGDYNAVAYPNVPAGQGHHGDDDDDDDNGNGGGAVAFWTDSRNGRGSGNPTNPDTFQPGRNPACEQADVFVDWFNPLSRNTGQHATKGMEHFLVTPCPAAATHETDDNDDNGDNDDD